MHYIFVCLNFLMVRFSLNSFPGRLGYLSDQLHFKRPAVRFFLVRVL